MSFLISISTVFAIPLKLTRNRCLRRPFSGCVPFRKHELEPGAMTQLDVEVRTSVTHTVTVRHVHDWLQRGVKTPKEAVLKERLRELMT